MFAENQDLTWLMSNYRELLLDIRLVSSANIIHSASVACGRSFIYNIKNIGARIDSWGTPFLRGRRVESFLSDLTYCRRCVKYDVNN